MNGYWLFVNGYLLFMDPGGFGLSSPDRCSEDAGKLAIFFDQVLNQDGWGHPSFLNYEQPDASLDELFDADSEFMYEVGTTLCPPALLRSLGREKCPNVGSGRKHDARQMFSASARPIQ
jgi:hypothetical protein